MKKLYTEKQYDEYCDLMVEMADENDSTASHGIYLEIQNWIKDNELSDEAMKQISQRINDEATGRRPELKRIK